MEKQEMTDRKSPEKTVDIIRQKIIDWLEKKWPMPRVCPICKHNKWNTIGTIHELREFHKTDFVVKGSIIPVIPVICSFCGYTLFFNALKSDLVTPRKKERGEKNGQQ